MKQKYLLPAAFLLSAHCASAATIIASDDFTGATEVNGGSFTTNQTTTNSNWATNVWTNGVNRDIRTNFEFPGTVIKLRNKDSSLERTIDLSAFDGTDLTIAFKYGYVGVEGGEQLRLQFDYGNGAISTLDTITLPTPTGSSQQGLFDYDFTFTFNEVGTGLQAIRIASDVNDGDESFFIDDVTITAVPEPSTALLGALGVLGLLRRRR